MAAGDMTPERWQGIAAMNAGTYKMSEADREQWYRDNPVSSFDDSAPASTVTITFDPEDATSIHAALRGCTRIPDDTLWRLGRMLSS